MDVRRNGPIELHPSMHRAFADAPRDVASAVAVVEKLNRAFGEFKEANDRRLREIEARGTADAVTEEKVDRINATITDLQKQLESVNAAVAAGKIGAGLTEEPQTAAARDHRKAFANWARRGGDHVEAQLRALQVQAALVSDVDPDGGFVVPETMESGITRVAQTRSVMRQIASVLTIGTASFTRLHNIAGTGSGWVTESQSRPETNTPRLAQIDYPTHELYANPAASQRVLDDASIDLESWLAEEIGIAFAEREGLAWISGSGVGQPRGFLSYDIVANTNTIAWDKVGRINTGAAAAFASSNPSDNLVDLQHALKPQYRPGASFLMNDATLAVVRKFKDSQGLYIWQPGLTAGSPSTLLGSPVNVDDNMPDIGANAFPVAYGDWQRAYQIIDRVGTRVLRDPYTNKPNVMFYTTKRVGGGVREHHAYKLLRCST